MHKSLKHMRYHARRILGQLCAVPATWSVVLDAGEQHYAKDLVDSELVKIVNVGGIECWKPTDAGRKAWRDATKGDSVSVHASPEDRLLSQFINQVDLVDAKLSTADLEEVGGQAAWNHMLWLRNDAAEFLSTKWKGEQA